ncbi:cohesin domain-containing protein [Membranihabitans marinus]|uniref:cohesin domain-containing protein n=1 Tax=Membranihabitans marinus TaxID=1227546 RepID=UPI001F00369D|nr:cohesin domain-containing protein [Membranihabitans marinus]
MIKYVLSLIVLISSFSAGFGQGKVVASDASGKLGDIVSVDITVDDFKNLFGFQILVTYDKSLLRLQSISNFASELSDYDNDNFVSNLDNANGIILTTYDNLNSDAGFTLANGSRLFTINFEIISNSATSVNVNLPQEVDFGEYSRELEVINNSYSNIGASTDGGVVTIESGTGGGNRIQLILGTAEGQTGETICVPMTVRDFNDVVGMQYSINFNTDVLEFVESKDFNLTGFSTASINTEHIGTSSALVVTWNSPSTDPISLGDGTVIVNLCFKIKASSGSSDLRFTSSPVVIEFAVPDGSGSTVAGQSQLTDGRISVAGSGGGGTTCDLTGFAVAAEQVSSPNGSTVCVNFTGKGINKLGVLQSLVTWDPTVLSNPTMEFVNLPGGGNDFNLGNGADGYMILVWTYSSADLQGTTLDDNSILFKMCFDVIGSNGQSSDIKFEENDRTKFLASDVEGNRFTFQSCSGKVTVGSSQGVSVTSNNPTCFGDNNGSISLNVSGGQSPYTYEWTKNGSNVGSTNNISSLTAGTYHYKVTDNSNAVIGEADVVLTEPSEIVIQSNVTPIVNGNDGAIALTVTGGSGNYMYNWSNGSDSKDISGLGQGSYTVTVTDGSGCSVSHEASIGDAEYTVEITATSNYNGFDISCFGESNGSLSAQAKFGKSPYTYKWSTGDESPTISNVGGGEYSVTATDADGETTTASYIVNEPERLTATIVTEPSNGVNAGTAQVFATGGAEPYSFSWNDKNPGSTTSFISGLAEGRYRVIVTDGNNCITQNEAVVPIDDQDCYVAVEVMTPNADGINDELRINCIEGSNNTLRLFNRWGTLVYIEDNYNNTWTGMDQDGSELSDGVYYFVLEVVDANNVISQYKGHVTLLRKLN